MKLRHLRQHWEILFYAIVHLFLSFFEPGPLEITTNHTQLLCENDVCENDIYVYICIRVFALGQARTQHEEEIAESGSAMVVTSSYLHR